MPHSLTKRRVLAFNRSFQTGPLLAVCGHDVHDLSTDAPSTANNTEEHNSYYSTSAIMIPFISCHQTLKQLTVYPALPLHPLFYSTSRQAVGSVPHFCAQAAFGETSY